MLFKRLPLVLLLFLIVYLNLTILAHASQSTSQSLSSRIALLLAPYSQGMPQLQVTILTPATQLASLCENPALRLPGHPTKLSGNHSVIASCGTHQKFIQVSVSATATYWLAAHEITPGQTVSQNDIQSQRGNIDHLPADLILDPQKIIGATPTRWIQPNHPLTFSELRQQWVIHTGEKVDIMTKGDDYEIHTTGKALDNATLRESFRVQMHSGQTLLATAVGNGKAFISQND